MSRPRIALALLLACAGCPARPVDDGTPGPAIAEASSCDGTQPAVPTTWHTRKLGDAGRGLAATSDGVLVALGRDRVYRSMDLGASWHDAGLDGISYFSSISAAGRRLVAVGSEDGLFGGLDFHAYESSDRGASWHDLAGAPRLSDSASVLVTSETRTYAGFVFDTAASLYATSGGAWSRVDDPFPSAPTGGAFTYGYLLGGHGDDVVYAAGFTSAPGAGQLGPDDAYVLRSADGGRTFASARLDEADGCSARVVWGGGAQPLIALGNHCVGGVGGMVWRSTDDGASFAASTIPTLPVVDDNHGTGFQLVAISGNTRGDIVAVGSAGTVLYSNDRGATFTRLPAPVSPGILGIGEDLDGVWVGPCGEVVITADDGTVTIGR